MRPRATHAALMGRGLGEEKAAHARRRDPLRRLLTRATADVMFWFPLLRWWLHRHVENAELCRQGRDQPRRPRSPCSRAAGRRRPTAHPNACDGRSDPSPDRAPARRGSADTTPASTLVALSVLGAIGAVRLVMCFGQGLLTAIGNDMTSNPRRDREAAVMMPPPSCRAAAAWRRASVPRRAGCESSAIGPTRPPNPLRTSDPRHSPPDSQFHVIYDIATTLKSLYGLCRCR
jgi:hypothetical protein